MFDRIKSWFSGSLFSQRKAAPRQLFDSWDDAFNSWRLQGFGMFNRWSLERGAKLYEQSILVYAAVETICRSMASIPLVMNVRAKSGRRRKWEEEPDDDMQELLEYPHPQLPAVTWRWLLAQRFACGGRLLVRPARDTTGKVQYLMPLLDSRYTEVPGPAETLIGWRPLGTDRIIPASEIAAAFLPHPVHIYTGMSPIQPAVVDADADRTIALLARKLAETGGVPRGFISSAFISDSATAREMREKWVAMEKEREEHKIPGMPNFISDQATWIPMGYTAQEAEWVRSREMYRVLVAISFGFLAAMWDSKSATYSNLRNAKEHLLKNVVLPWLDSIVGALNLVLIPPGQRRHRRVGYQTGHIPELRGDLKAASLAMKNLVECGIPPNQVIRALHLPFDETELGDEILVGRGLMLLRQML